MTYNEQSHMCTLQGCMYLYRNNVDHDVCLFVCYNKHQTQLFETLLVYVYCHPVHKSMSRRKAVCHRMYFSFWARG